LCGGEIFKWIFNESIYNILIRFWKILCMYLIKRGINSVFYLLLLLFHLIVFCYELMIVHWFDTFTHMIHYSLWYIFVLTKLICFLYGLHIVSINRTLPINNKTQMSCSLFSHSLFSLVSSLLYYLSSFSMLFALFHNTLSARCFNQLRTSGSFFSITTVLCVSQSRLFLILSQIIILTYILPLAIRIV